MEYNKYLKTDEWQRTRRWALDRAGNKCQLCKSTTNLNVHHSDYSRLGKEEPQDVIVLCERCHKIHHDNQVKKKVRKPKFEFNPVIKDPKIFKLIKRLEQKPSEAETILILAEIDKINRLNRK